MNNEKLNTLKQKVALAANAYWDEYTMLNGEKENAIIWVRNDITGEMLCLTKGGYSTKLSGFIDGLW
ncbi:hypothetical protein H7F15_05870 [Pontibacter sp. Tf4]|uniref:hypothetical protein n=1 Tax=Pontibacter sp. Tf4 TaxID=2761620 RepID=UPI00162376BF|nr:hypothetical protein [Pontibacter sp. Tf4]MBB6610556.1 hypothetical protein [Pontibacter sp. Tf4]